MQAIPAQSLDRSRWSPGSVLSRSRVGVLADPPAQLQWPKLLLRIIRTGPSWQVFPDLLGTGVAFTRSGKKNECLGADELGPGPTEKKGTVMPQEQPKRGDSIAPLDWLKFIPFKAVAASGRAAETGRRRACSGAPDRTASDPRARYFWNGVEALCAALSKTYPTFVMWLPCGPIRPPYMSDTSQVCGVSRVLRGSDARGLQRRYFPPCFLSGAKWPGRPAG